MRTAALVFISLLCTNQPLAEESAIERGAYLLHAGGCISCHTADDAEPLTGGHALVTAFGTFYVPNITPDEATGIGAWSDDDFVRAMREGLSPDGSHYYPAFPYTSYTGMTQEDVLAIKAYLFSLDPVAQTNREHELPWYLFSRVLAGAWKFAFFTSERFAADTNRPASWNRGAYLVRHVGHCEECHTPRNLLGAPIGGLTLTGNADGPDGKKVPNITPDDETGIGKWSADEIAFFLEIGMLPDGDFTGGAMSPVIDDNTSHLTTDDRNAIVEYLQSLPASNFGGEPRSE